MLGGLARRVSLVEKLKDEGKPILVVDSGSLPSDNRFVWTLIPLDRSLPEDKVVSAWIRKEGIERD